MLIVFAAILLSVNCDWWHARLVLAMGGTAVYVICKCKLPYNKSTSISTHRERELAEGEVCLCKGRRYIGIYSRI
jgi:hypothetical protein